MDFDRLIGLIVIYSPMIYQLVSGWRMRNVLSITGRAFNIICLFTSLILIWPLFVPDKDQGVEGLVLLIFIIPAYLLTLSVAFGNIVTWIVLKLGKKPSVIAYSLSIFVIGWVSWLIVSELFPS